MIDGGTSPGLNANDAAATDGADVAALQATIAKLNTDNGRLASEKERFRKLYLDVLETCRKLERGILGQKRERLLGTDASTTMSLLGMLLGEQVAPGAPAAPPSTPVREHTRQKPTGRRPIPDSLPRIDIEILPPEVERQGLDAFEKVGEDVRETVERRPGSLVVVRVHRPKFVPRNRPRNAETAFFQARPPELPIERGLAGPGLLAQTIVRRFQDHLPLNRQENIFARDGWVIPRATICDWHLALADLIAPLINAMWKDALRAPYLCTDATGVLVQAKDKCRLGHFWVLVAAELHVLFGYTPKHDKAAVDRVLGDYKGLLVADAHTVFDHLYRWGVIEVGCWAHARRYFFRTLGSDAERAHTGLAFINGLFKIERDFAAVTPDERLQVRQQMSKPLVDAFFTWCDEQVDLVVDETPAAAAIRYARNQRVALSRFLDDGRLPIHNNESERQLRRQAIGRKNWLFVGSDHGGEVNAAFVSLLASCQLHEIDPWRYIRDLLCLLPNWHFGKVLDLAPAYWRATSAKPEVQRILEANIYRRATLMPVESHQPDP